VEREAWERGALAVERYRAVHGVEDAAALGRTPEGHSAAALEQRHDWGRAGGAVLDAREQLGLADPRDWGSLEQRLEKVAGMLTERPEHELERDMDRGMER